MEAVSSCCTEVYSRYAAILRELLTERTVFFILFCFICDYRCDTVVNTTDVVS